MILRLFVSPVTIAVLVLFVVSCDSGSPSGESSPVFPTRFDHTIHPESYEYVWDTADIRGGTTELTLRVFKPDFATADTPLPVVVLLNTGSFSVSDSFDNEQNRTEAAEFVASGAICILVETRIQQDRPSEPDGSINGAENDLAQSINAIIWDAYRALLWVQSNPVNEEDDWAIWPEWTFFGGGSSSGIATMCAVIRHYPDELNILGMITRVTAFGADNALLGLNYTDEVRDQLGHTEAQYTPDLPPMCAFMTGADYVINTAPNNWTELFREQIEANGAPSVVHWYEEGGHIFFEDWDERNGLSDASTVKEAIFNFITTAIVTHENKIQSTQEAH